MLPFFFLANSVCLLEGKHQFSISLDQPKQGNMTHENLLQLGYFRKSRPGISGFLGATTFTGQDWGLLGPWSQVSFPPGNLPGISGEPNFYPLFLQNTTIIYITYYTIWKSSDLIWISSEFPQDCGVPEPGAVFFISASPSSLLGPYWPMQTLKSLADPYSGENSGKSPQVFQAGYMGSIPSIQMV